MAFLAVLLVFAASTSVSGGSADSAEASMIPVSSGTTLTIYEATYWAQAYSFSVSAVLSTGVEFSTDAILSEDYSVTSDGDYVRIECYCVPPAPRTGTETGSNVVAVRLDGVPGYPEGLWASEVVGYSTGLGGIEESVVNALGPASQEGPYLDSLCTYLGDYSSEIVLGFSVVTQVQIVAALDINPNHLNPASNGKWVTAYIELPDGYDVADIAVGTLLLNGAVPADGSKKACVGDYDDDGVPDIKVKFSREALIAVLEIDAGAEIVVTGELSDGTLFIGGDTICVADPSAAGPQNRSEGLSHPVASFVRV
jgi:hypothetical protein